MPLRYSIIQAPSRLGLHAAGVERMPDALLEAGLASAVGARLAARVEPPAWSGNIDSATGVLNAAAIGEYAVQLAAAIGDALERGEFPVVLGGDCSILLGGLTALRRRGRHGLLFLDGHADFYQPEAESTGEAASMELGFATGRGPRVVSDVDGLSPLVRDEDVVVLGPRDGDQAAAEGSRPLPDSIRALDLQEVRSLGAARAAQLAVEHFSDGNRAERFWIHLDVDVLDDELMPAVDYRLPGGLTWNELHVILTAALGSGRATGMEVTIFNPDLDPSGALSSTLSRQLTGILTAHDDARDR